MHKSGVDMHSPAFHHSKDASQLDKEKTRSPQQTSPQLNELDLVSETDLSFGSILKGTAAKPLTVFERKAALINT